MRQKALSYIPITQVSRFAMDQRNPNHVACYAEHLRDRGLHFFARRGHYKAQQRIQALSFDKDAMRQINALRAANP
jgi:hypothetical protein